MKAAYLIEKPSIGTLATKLHLDQQNVPTPLAQNLKPHDILVRVQAFSINVDDIHVAEGSFLGGVPGLQRAASSPLVIGSDFAGIILAVGTAVSTQFTVGQRVCGMNKQQAIFSERGTWAEYTITHAANIVTIPDHVSVRDAAAMVLPLFVIHGLLETAQLQRTDRVVVIGASGGIGSVLLPVLRTMFPDEEFHITGICSGRNVDFVKKLGADRVVDYTQGPIEDSLERGTYDVVFDLVGGPASYASARALLRPHGGGRFLTSTGPVEWVGDTLLSPLEQGVLLWKLFWFSVLKNYLPGSHPHYSLVAPKDVSDDTFQRAFAAKVRPHIDQVIPFEDGPAFQKAIELVRSHRVKGKVIVEVN